MVGLAELLAADERIVVRQTHLTDLAELGVERPVVVDLACTRVVCLRGAGEAPLGGIEIALTTTADGYFPRFGFERIERSQVPATVRESVEFTSACPAYGHTCPPLCAGTTERQVKATWTRK